MKSLFKMLTYEMRMNRHLRAPLCSGKWGRESGKLGNVRGKMGNQAEQGTRRHYHKMETKGAAQQDPLDSSGSALLPENPTENAKI